MLWLTTSAARVSGRCGAGLGLCGSSRRLATQGVERPTTSEGPNVPVPVYRSVLTARDGARVTFDSGPTPAGCAEMAT